MSAQFTNRLSEARVAGWPKIKKILGQKQAPTFSERQEMKVPSPSKKL